MISENERVNLERIKKNIRQLIEHGFFYEAKGLLDNLLLTTFGDADIYAMYSTLEILNENYEDAQNWVARGLSEGLNTYDLLFNKAYILENEKRYFEALLTYRQALSKWYYEINKNEISEMIESAKSRILSTGNEKECLSALIDSVLFVDFGSSKETHDIARKVSDIGITVDRVHGGQVKWQEFVQGESSYRKLVIEYEYTELLAYIRNYKYDVIQLFNMPFDLSNNLKKEGLPICEENLAGKGAFEVLKTWGKYKLRTVPLQKVEKEYKLTIILPTYNRHEHFCRALKSIAMYSAIESIVIVLDSSKDEVKAVNQMYIDEISEVLEVKYLAYPEGTTYAAKIKDGFWMVKSEYFAITPDDDYFAEEGLVESLRIMHEDGDVFTAKGKNLCFWEDISHLYEYEVSRPLMQESAKERLKVYSEGAAFAITYQVFRTKPYLELWKFYEENNDLWCKNDVFIEYTFNFLLIMTGKIAKLSTDLNIRNKGIERQFTVDNIDKSVFDGSFIDEYGNMKSIMKKYALHLGHKLTTEDIDGAFINFLVLFLQVPQQYVEIKNGMFNMSLLEKGIKHSWVYSERA